MAWYPEAVRESLTKTSGTMPKPVRINLHTAVSSSTSLRTLFNISGQPWSHFYVNRHGVVYQYRDTAYHARCDLDGNPDTISIETWDGYRRAADGRPVPLDLDGVTGWRSDSDVPAWTAAQVAAIKKLVAWILAAHPTIPPRLAKSNRPGSESHGLSWHRLGVPGYAELTEAQGGLMYSTSRGKVCPGDRRIAQIPGILAGATNATQSEEDDMPYTRDQLLEIVETAVARQLWAPLVPGRSDVGGSSVRNNLLHQSLSASQLVALVRQLAARSGIDVDEAAIAAQVAASVAPILRAALVEAVTAGGSPEVIADAVVAKLGAALQG